MTARAARTPDRRYTYKEIAVPLYRVEPLYGAVLIQLSMHTAPSTTSLSGPYIMYNLLGSGTNAALDLQASAGRACARFSDKP